MSITRYCAELLEAASHYHVRYGDRLANHLPMVLIALDKMGASHAQLQHAFDRSIPYLERPQFLPPEPNASILDCRNRDELFPSALQYYEKQLRQYGIAECLKKELPPLLPAIATAAFHPLIRTAYGIDTGHLEEVAAGLAYWNLEFRTLPASQKQIPVPAADILPMLAQHFPLIALAPGNISDHMMSVTGQAGWTDTPIQPEILGLEDIAQVAINSYLGTGDFTLLHGVTSCHALRLMFSYCPVPETALREYWKGLAIAYMSTGPKPFSSSMEEWRLWDWETVQERACASNDDHIIKMSYSCQQEGMKYGELAYLYAANSLFH